MRLSNIVRSHDKYYFVDTVWDPMAGKYETILCESQRQPVTDDPEIIDHNKVKFGRAYIETTQDKTVARNRHKAIVDHIEEFTWRISR